MVKDQLQKDFEKLVTKISIDVTKSAVYERLNILINSLSSDSKSIDEKIKSMQNVSLKIQKQVEALSDNHEKLKKVDQNLAQLQKDTIDYSKEIIELLDRQISDSKKTCNMNSARINKEISDSQNMNTLNHQILVKSLNAIKIVCYIIMLIIIIILLFLINFLKG